MMDFDANLWIGLALVCVPILAFASLALWLILGSPPNVPLWANGTIKNGRMAAGLLLLGIMSWASVIGLSRVAEHIIG